MCFYEYQKVNDKIYVNNYIHIESFINKKTCTLEIVSTFAPFYKIKAKQKYEVLSILFSYVLLDAHVMYKGGTSKHGM